MQRRPLNGALGRFSGSPVEGHIFRRIRIPVMSSCSAVFESFSVAFPSFMLRRVRVIFRRIPVMLRRVRVILSNLQRPGLGTLQRTELREQCPTESEQRRARRRTDYLARFTSSCGSSGKLELRTYIIPL